jgi:nucleoside-diphosphate-sugar epimerase
MRRIERANSWYRTGATGYIGGDTLFALYEKHSDYEVTALVRTGKSLGDGLPHPLETNE